MQKFRCYNVNQSKIAIGSGGFTGKGFLEGTQTKFEFANIWEHRKTQKILIAGFQTLEQAINNMKYEILSAINNLNHSIKSEFRELRNIQIEQIRSIEAGNAALNRTLTSMDTKLYYLEYNKKPTTPFVRPLFD